MMSLHSGRFLPIAAAQHRGGGSPVHDERGGGGGDGGDGEGDEEQGDYVANKGLSVSVIGDRKRAHKTDVSFASLKETTALVIEDLLEDSQFFDENLPRVLATFDNRGKLA